MTWLLTIRRPLGPSFNVMIWQEEVVERVARVLGADTRMTYLPYTADVTRGQLVRAVGELNLLPDDDDLTVVLEGVVDLL